MTSFLNCRDLERRAASIEVHLPLGLVWIGLLIISLAKSCHRQRYKWYDDYKSTIIRQVNQYLINTVGGRLQTVQSVLVVLIVLIE